jgi:hypothetical protein
MRLKIDKIEAPQEVNGGELKLVLRVEKETISALEEAGVDVFMDAFKLSRAKVPIFVTDEGVDTHTEPKTPYSALQSVAESLQSMADAMQKAGEITQDEASGLFEGGE